MEVLSLSLPGLHSRSHALRTRKIIEKYINIWELQGSSSKAGVFMFSSTKFCMTPYISFPLLFTNLELLDWQSIYVRKQYWIEKLLYGPPEKLVLNRYQQVSVWFEQFHLDFIFKYLPHFYLFQIQHFLRCVRNSALKNGNFLAMLRTNEIVRAFTTWIILLDVLSQTLSGFRFLGILSLWNKIRTLLKK